MKYSNLWLIGLLFLLPLISFAQVGINSDDSTPDASAMLDVKSTNKGVLIPRMTSDQRTLISNAAIGLLVFDTDTESFWFNDSNGWTELVSGVSSTLADADNDTKIQAEESADEDIIRFDIAGTESMLLKKVGPANRTQLSFPNNTWDIFIGEGTGQALEESSVSTAVGYNAFKLNDFGISNAAFGAFSLENNESGHYNTAIGTLALQANKGSRNTGLGNESLLKNTTGNNNVGIGYNAGLGNQEGNNNVFIGDSAGGESTTHNKSNNVMVGFEAGYNNKNDGNVFLGYQAGKNEMGSNKLYIDNSAATAENALIYGEFDNDLLLINGTLNINSAFSFPLTDGAQEQVLSTDGNGTLNWVDLNDTDNQTIDELKLSGNTLEISLEDDGQAVQTVDLSAINSVQDLIANSSNTTKVDVSSSSLISFEADGQEVLTLQRGNLELRNTNGSIYMGGDAGKSDNFTGFGNIGIGPNALSSNSTGSNNTAIGNNTDIGSSNLSNATAIGASALVNQSNALVLGNNADVGIGTSNPDEKLHIVGNIKIEDGNAQAGYVLTSDADGVGTWQENTGSSSVQDLIQDTDGNTKVQVEKNNNDDVIRFDLGGVETFRMTDSRLEIIDPLASIYIGVESGSNRDNQQSFFNVMLGHQAGQAITQGANNVGLGGFALGSNQTGGNNTVVGAFGARLNTSGSNNVAVGTRAIFENETGGNNVAIGTDAGKNNEGSGSIFVGYQAGENEVGSNKLYIENSNATSPLIYGDFSNDSLSVNGNLTVAGDRLVFENTYENMFIGKGAGFNNVDDGSGLNNNGRVNYFIGDSTGYHNTIGQFNTGLASRALYSNTTGGFNTALGNYAMQHNTEGVQNTAVGMHGLSSNIDGDGNTSLGYGAGGINESGSANVFVGGASGGFFNVQATNISQNVMLGFGAGGNNAGNANIFVGYDAGREESGSNKLYIENSNSTAPLLYGEFDNDLIRINGDLEVTGTFPGSDDQKIDVLNLNGHSLEVSLENDGQATQTLDLSNLATPVGAIMMWATDTPPDGWVLCQGQDITAYPQLVTVLGSNNAPNLEDKFPYGAGPFRNLGQSGGREAVVLQEANIPQHSHDAGTLKTTYDYKSNNSSAGSASNKDGSDVQFYNGNDVTGNTGTWGGAANGLTQSFEIIPPYLALNFIIKAE